jgi:transposase-like protein
LTTKEEKEAMSTRTSFRYSNAFKQKVIGEIESGILSIAEASRIYEISLGGIYNWIKDFGKDHLIGKVVMVQKRDEVDKIKKLEAEKRQLEAGLRISICSESRTKVSSGGNKFLDKSLS